MSDFYTDPETGVIYWRNEHGILRPRVLTNADGKAIAYEQAEGWFSGRVGAPDEADCGSCSCVVECEGRL